MLMFLFGQQGLGQLAGNMLTTQVATWRQRCGEGMGGW